ncbi:hypothetical protein CDAR_78691 [Caerostris darwini]|uniref:Uncharacterized protein n=1 Tax=Caerostris darwini TaxID=1538125 RepID=A0AAV4QWV2_9ARAC|nr:hypothetical protein CDAR_78691 [Caerostris darwini]
MVTQFVFDTNLSGVEVWCSGVNNKVICLCTNLSDKVSDSSDYKLSTVFKGKISCNHSPSPVFKIKSPFQDTSKRIINKQVLSEEFTQRRSKWRVAIYSNWVQSNSVRSVCRSKLRNNKRRQAIVLGERRAQKKGHPIFDPNHFHPQSFPTTEAIRAHLSSGINVPPGNSATVASTEKDPPPSFYAHIVWGVGWLGLL